MRAPLGWSAVALLASLCPQPSLAQETTGRLEGRVLDVKGQPVADVNVGVTSPSLQGGRGCLTNARGTFVLLALPVGEYRVKLAHLAYQAQVIEGVRVRLGQTTMLGDVRLPDAVFDQPEVVVSGKRPLIDPRSTETGGVLNSKDYSALPIERDYRSVATLLPQVSPSFLGDPMNIAGSTGLDNRFTMDGIDVTDPNRGATATALPYNFVQEVEVRTGGYEAEHRSALGGIVNAITYAGGNEITGTAFGYYTRNRPAADPRYVFQKDPGDFSLYDVGFGLGGPVQRDQLWYYLAYNPTFTRDDVLIPGIGRHLDQTTTHRFAAKLTWRASQANSFVLAVIGDPTWRQGVGATWINYGPMQAALNPEVWLEDIRSGSLAGRVEGRHLLGRQGVLRSSLSWTRFLDRNMPAAANETLFVDEPTRTWSGGAPDRVDNRSDQVSAGLNGTWVFGAHEVKTGVEYKDSRWKTDFTNLRILAHANGTYDLLTWSSQGTVGNRVPSAFVQDSWRIGERLRLNAGLRWDGLYIVSSEGRVAQSILNQWQPRGGLVWQPSPQGLDKVSASAGRFYHDLATWPLTFYFNTGSFNADYTYDHDPRTDPTGGVPVYVLPGAIQPRIHGLKGQYYDEYALGYERRVAAQTKVGLHGMLRILGKTLEDGQDPSTEIYYWANPGSGPLSMYPRATRRYNGLELSLTHEPSARLSVSGSYVLSRVHGNYPGLFNSDFNFPFPSSNGSFDVISIMDKSTGLLPNDRTHVAKLIGRYVVGLGVTLGVMGAWGSGTPLSEFGWGPWLPVFLTPRGTAGRTPAIWDLSARVGYELPLPSTGRPRITLDLMHIGSPRKPVTYDMQHYFDVDAGGNPTSPNPNYQQPTQYQPGFAVRIGAEVAF